MEDCRLIQYGEYPEFYADGVAAIETIGTNLSVLFYRWRRVDGLLQRCVAGELIRPRATLPLEFAIWKNVPELAQAVDLMLLH
jgi:hypothetical protein